MLKTQVFLALVVICVARPQAVTDTPEVQAAKKRFFDVFNIAVAAAPKLVKPSTVENSEVTKTNLDIDAPVSNILSSDPSNPTIWIGPLASAIPAWVPGYEKQVRNTPEVEAATAEFNRAFSAQLVAIKAARNPKGLGYNKKSRTTYFNPNAPAGNQHVF